MNTIQITHAIIAGFIGVTMSLPSLRLIAIDCKTCSISGDHLSIYFQSNSRQNITNVVKKSHILHANLFCTAPTHIGSLFLIKTLTIFQKMEKSGEINTFKTKSNQIIQTNTSGIKKFALKRTRKKEKNPNKSVTHVAIRISYSFTKPYLSFLSDSFLTNFQYIVLK